VLRTFRDGEVGALPALWLRAAKPPFAGGLGLHGAGKSQGMKRMKIISGGHMDVPASVQKRWGTHSVLLEDHGEYVVVRPTADEAAPAIEPEEHWPTETSSEGGRRASSGAGY
jgi:hypothetical protein